MGLDFIQDLEKVVAKHRTVALLWKGTILMTSLTSMVSSWILFGCIMLETKNILLYKCEWFDVDKGKSRILQEGAITSVRVDRAWYSTDPYVLASQATQVYYVSDPKLGSNWRVVQRFNHRHIFSGEIETSNILDDFDMVDDDEAYQDDELTNVPSTVVDVYGDGEIPLHREGVVAEVIDLVVVEGKYKN
ncbi:unnamed protein product [Linum trigynum]|uniref:DUF4216 domain-containing protein n=1 Tax=Linum trigynum TaxID=586398 RepID=A0AAV2FZC0_9ROSI